MNNQDIDSSRTLALCMPKSASGFSAALLGLLFLCTVSYAEETVYVADVLYVPLFSGESTRHKIVHRGLKSGTPLELVRRKEKFTKVRLRSGTEGWIENQYISDNPIARTLLRDEQRQRIELQEKIRSLNESNRETSQNKSELEKKVSTLSKNNQSLSRELASIKKISANAINLDVNNRELLQKNELLKVKIAELQTENARLSDKSNRDWFVRGALAVAIGALLAIIIPKFKPRSKNSEWA